MDSRMQKRGMDVRACLFLFVLGAFCCCSARELSTNNIQEFDVVSALQIKNQQPKTAFQDVGEVGRNEQLCTMCEQYAAEALDYLSRNKTQQHIIHALHKSCSKLPSFKVECVSLVDYYVPLFFLEVTSKQPDDFCRTVDLCEQVVSISRHLSKDSCDLCHSAVTEAILKLKDPDTQLEIIEVLLKACDSAKSYVKKCKRLVFEYGPVILVNAEQFLETNDICTILHACGPPNSGTGTGLPSLETSMHSAY